MDIAENRNTELLDWMSEIKNTPEKVFIVHGEATSAKVFSDKVTETYGWNCKIPELYSIEDVSLKKMINLGIESIL